MMRFRNRRDPAQITYPVRWLTYKTRLREDLRELYERKDGKEFFSKEYVDALSAEAKQLERWVLKLWAWELAIAAFIAIGFLSGDASISIFGVSLKNATGVKEVLLAFSATITFGLIILNSSKEALLHVIQCITEFAAPKDFIDFARLAMPTSFGVKMYIAKQYNRWVFSTFLTQLLFVILLVLLTAATAIIFACLIGFSIWIFLEIYQRPTLGIWSTAVLVYVSLSWVFGVIWTIRFTAPMPYQDLGILKKLNELQKTDPAAHRRLLEKVRAGKLESS